MFFNSAVLLAGAGFAVAQSLSSQCESTLLSIAASSSDTCLNPSALVSIALLNSSSSIIPGVNTWLSGLCSQGACSNSTLQTVVTAVVSGCSTELASLGLTTTDPTALVSSIQDAYPTVRQLVCLKDTSTSTLCTPEVLTNIQSATATNMTLNNTVALITKLVTGQSAGVPSSAICVDCTKAAYTVLNQGLPSIANATQSPLSSQCGTNYTDGQMPSDIQESASNSSSSTTSSSGAIALSVSSLNMGAAVVAAVSAAFAILA
ncbi:uncharacterized protein EDB91DRAFT_1045387 [Suillus paluster]|uniref:uncharacterized protein n=1 Tax=Suillus paluster TaxID=48578 RepID=UPI001B86C429|nr:uncharacterized protein EDB91DRAFT_1045387 [Suillus paluster]KAG1751535.1 hypothetical protein EDB91DRAFT_1045387 [Suillus paluster]